ncbi:MAG TPA: ATP-binding protein [Reyranellaceae bacterium]|nr:ATP-binding protein [Reyranellaceae bacterium]
MDSAHIAYALAAFAAVAAVAMFVILQAYRQESERQRAASEAVRARLQAALNAVPVEFVEYDKDRRLILANQAARNVSPWRTPGAAGGKTIDEVFANYVSHFATPGTIAAWTHWAAQNVADFDKGGVAELLRPDGQWRRSYVSDMPGGGRVVVRVDITEEKRNQAKMAADMALFRSIFESTGAGILMLDREANVVLANQFVLDVEGKTAEAIVGRPYAELRIAGLSAETVDGWRAARGNERLKAIEFEHGVTAADGSRHIFRTTANPVQDDGGLLRHIVLIGVDDTDRRRNELRLFESARLANLGEMATGMAHEINQPLAVIRMATETVQDEVSILEPTALPGEFRSFLDEKLSRISAQVERAAKLVNELRAVARKPTEKSEPFDVCDAARVASDLLQEQLKAVRIYLVLNLPTAGPRAEGEAARLQQVLINLIINSRDALLERSEERPSGPIGHISLTVSEAKDAAVITVEDDGPGIPDQALAKLFEPFFTTKPTGKGTGLGLSISYDIIKRMGGEITAENRSEGGARFRIELPPVAVPVR